MVWTCFWDMHSGGGQKLFWAKIYIEAPEEVAKVIFQNRFDRSPERVSCTCCGEDYSIDESPTLEQATAYHRGLCFIERADKTWYEMSEEERNEELRKNRYLEPEQEIPKGYKLSYGEEGDGITLSEYRDRKDVLIIPMSEVSPSEMEGELREEGYVWVGDDE